MSRPPARHRAALPRRTAAAWRSWVRARSPSPPTCRPTASTASASPASGAGPRRRPRRSGTGSRSWAGSTPAPRSCWPTPRCGSSTWRPGPRAGWTGSRPRSTRASTCSPRSRSRCPPTTSTGCPRVLARAEAAGVRVAVNHNGRWAPPWRAATLLLRDGAVGDVVGVTHLHDKPLPPLAGTPFDDVPHMLLTDYLLHWVDITRTWLADGGAGQVVSVQAADSRVPGQPDDGAQPVVGHAVDDRRDGRDRDPADRRQRGRRPSPAARSGCTAPPGRCGAACCSTPTASSSTTDRPHRRAAARGVVRRRLRGGHGRADVRGRGGPRSRRTPRPTPRESVAAGAGGPASPPSAAGSPGRGRDVSDDADALVDEVPVDPATRPGLRRGLAELEPGDLVPAPARPAAAPTRSGST